MLFDPILLNLHFLSLSLKIILPRQTGGVEQTPRQPSYHVQLNTPTNIQRNENPLSKSKRPVRAEYPRKARSTTINYGPKLYPNDATASCLRLKLESQLRYNCQKSMAWNCNRAQSMKNRSYWHLYTNILRWERKWKNKMWGIVYIGSKGFGLRHGSMEVNQ